MANWDQRINTTIATTGKSIKEIDAEADRQVMLTKARGAAMSIRLIEDEKREVVQNFVESMSKVANQVQLGIGVDNLIHFLSIVEEMCKRVVWDDLTARSYIEALENMAKGKGARIVLSGGSQPNLLIGLGEESAGEKQ
jgi:hypothetical protein